jgi:HSP20 family protein
MPAVDVERKDGRYLVRADLPGIDKNDIQVELQNGYLMLSGERKAEHEEGEGEYKRIERSYGRFERSFKVPDGVSEKDIKAKYRDGVMEITFPAPAEEAQSAKRIAVE